MDRPFDHAPPYRLPNGRQWRLRRFFQPPPVSVIRDGRLLLIEYFLLQAVDFRQFLTKPHASFSGFCLITHSLANQLDYCRNGYRARLNVFLLLPHQ